MAHIPFAHSLLAKEYGQSMTETDANEIGKYIPLKGNDRKHFGKIKFFTKKVYYFQIYWSISDIKEVQIV